MTDIFGKDINGLPTHIMIDGELKSIQEITDSLFVKEKSLDDIILIEKLSELKRTINQSFIKIQSTFSEKESDCELSYEIGFQHANILNKIEELTK